MKAPGFHDRVDRNGPNGCWLWTGARKADGYGVVSWWTDGVSTSTTAHRVAYELAKGPVPVGLVIDHLCATRGCVNPDHLEAVTQAENLRRSRERRGPDAVCRRGHAYTPENTGRRPDGGRLCIACRVARTERAA